MTDAFFKNLEQQKKDMGMAYWACRSCLSFAAKMQTQLKEVDRKLEKLKEQVEENTDGIGKANDKIGKVEKSVGTVGRKIEDMERRLEENMMEEMRAREAIKRNIVLHGVDEPAREMRDGKERMEADKVECENIFRATGSKATKRDIQFCRRIGEKGADMRPLLVGLTSEVIKAEILERASKLRETEYSEVTIAPDQTKKQRQAETRLNQEVERKNREELTEEDMAKNLKWMAVGRKGEKRVIKGQIREEEGEYRNQRGRGRGRGRGTGTGRNTNRPAYTRDSDMDTSDQHEKGKRTREEGEDTEEEEERPPRTRSRQ